MVMCCGRVCFLFNKFSVPSLEHCAIDIKIKIKDDGGKKLFNKNLLVTNILMQNKWRQKYWDKNNEDAGTNCGKNTSMLEKDRIPSMISLKCALVSSREEIK